MRILVVEDDKTLGETIALSLRREGYAVDWVETASAALQCAIIEHFDLILLDLGLPDDDGHSIIRSLRERGQQVPMLILSARDGLDERVKGLDEGADDYVVKPIAMPELHARVRALLRRRMNAASPRINVGNLELDTIGKRVFVNGAAIELSAREWSVLEYLVGRAGKIVSKDQLIQAITDWQSELSQNAIEAYVHRVRSKIEHSDVVIRTVRGLGYMLEEPAVEE